MIIIESVILCVVFTLMVYIMSRNPIATLYNYPPKIQERVKSLEEYKGQIPTTQNKVFAKVTAALVIVVIVSLILKHINGYDTFWEAFIGGFIIWTIVNAYDALIIDCVWFCHAKEFVFKGTEDMVDEYHNYWFHIKESLKGELIGAGVCVVVGLVIQFIL